MGDDAANPAAHMASRYPEFLRCAAAVRGRPHRSASGAGFIGLGRAPGRAPALAPVHGLQLGRRDSRRHFAGRLPGLAG